MQALGPKTIEARRVSGDVFYARRFAKNKRAASAAARSSKRAARQEGKRESREAF